ncbi:ATP-binding cassette domain-containing protein [Curtobacterium sp. RRHDQ10]|uniref:ATP-binding cassette domain-containing protein n=1 Tax=Curtobacterium phyllosphaerae TaxID=3413379 RepID=UPI003BF1D194
MIDAPSVDVERGPVDPPARTGGAARIVFDGWGYRYGERDGWAVRGVDLVVEPGERVAVVGPSGSGKSTLLRAVAGVLPDSDGGDDDGGGDAEAGRCTVDGREPRGVRGRVGLVMQDPEAHTVMSRVGDDVAFGPENLAVPRSDIWSRVDHALEVVGLDLPQGRATSTMSGGQRQRLALAGVLAMRPGALVLDEPCANLDPDGTAAVHDAVRALLDHSRATFLVVEHRIGTWLDLVDRLVVLAPGEGVVVDGPPAAVLRDHAALLRDAGVWVPGAGIDPVRSADPGAVLLRTDALTTARTPGTPVGRAPDLALRAGECLAVTGPNGVGKSTLGLTLAGLLPPEHGAVVATAALVPVAAGAVTAGVVAAGSAGDVGPHPIDWSSATLAVRIGTVFQEPAHQFVAGTVADELAAGPRAVGMAESAVGERVDELLDALGLSALADANPFTLSGGEQRRLAIGAAVAVRPRVVVLDEPTSGQDRRTWHQVVDVLGALLAGGTALVAVTHDAALVEALGAQEVRLQHPSAESSVRGPVPGPAPGPEPVSVRGLAVNPAASLVGVLVLAVCLVTSLDVVSATTALALELLLLPLVRVRLGTLLRRGAPLLVAGPLAGVGIALYGRADGRTLFDLGLVHVTDGSLGLALATVLRLIAIGLPTIALFARVDPTDLADGLAQVLRLPARFVLGALAAIRMTTLMREDWRVLGMARRARGTAGRGRFRRGASMAFALLVLALRRATTLAVAMESRGFGAPGRRTWARESRFGPREWAMLAALLGIGLAAIGAAVAAGTWHTL